MNRREGQTSLIGLEEATNLGQVLGRSHKLVLAPGLIDVQLERVNPSLGADGGNGQVLVAGVLEDAVPRARGEQVKPVLHGSIVLQVVVVGSTGGPRLRLGRVDVQVGQGLGIREIGVDISSVGAREIVGNVAERAAQELGTGGVAFARGQAADHLAVLHLEELAVLDDGVGVSLLESGLRVRAVCVDVVGLDLGAQGDCEPAVIVVLADLRLGDTAQIDVGEITLVLEHKVPGGRVKETTVPRHLNSSLSAVVGVVSKTVANHGTLKSNLLLGVQVVDVNSLGKLRHLATAVDVASHIEIVGLELGELRVEGLHSCQSFAGSLLVVEAATAGALGEADS